MTTIMMMTICEIISKKIALYVTLDECPYFFSSNLVTHPSPRMAMRNVWRCVWIVIYSVGYTHIL